MRIVRTLVTALGNKCPGNAIVRNRERAAATTTRLVVESDDAGVASRVPVPDYGTVIRTLMWVLYVVWLLAMRRG
jgi:hypothetical protein